MNAQTELQNAVNVSRVKRLIYYPLSVKLTSTGETTTDATVSTNIVQDWAFQCRGMTGQAYGFSNTANSIFPLPIRDTTSGSGTVRREWDGRGLYFRLSDGGHGVPLTNGWIAFHEVFSPGFGTPAIGRFFPFRYIFQKSSFIQMEFRWIGTDTRTLNIDVLFHGFHLADKGRDHAG